MQLYSALLPLSAPYNSTFHTHDAYAKSSELILFLHFRVRSLDMLMSIEIDKSQ